MALKFSDPWWMTDEYHSDKAVPLDFNILSGVHGPALVKLWDTGQTQPGWGLVGKDGADGFMKNYNNRVFHERRVLYGYEKDKWAFAFVMRSVNIVAIDIDGKNGGLDHAEELLAGAPPTLAETSKSGNGYHLFYKTDDSWDDEEGFGGYADQISIVTGVDIRGVGCVYHYNTQRWNGRSIAQLPKHLADRLKQKTAAKKAASTTIKKVLETLDIEEILIMQDDILEDLAKPMKAGSRNTTLFAIGARMNEAEIPDWEDKLIQRADEVGISQEEAEKIVANISAYAK